MTSHTRQDLLKRIYNMLMVRRFRDYSRGWYRGYIVVAAESPEPWYCKRIKRVNPTVRLIKYDIVSAYPDRIATTD